MNKVVERFCGERRCQVCDKGMCHIHAFADWFMREYPFTQMSIEAERTARKRMTGGLKDGQEYDSEHHRLGTQIFATQEMVHGVRSNLPAGKLRIGDTTYHLQSPEDSLSGGKTRHSIETTIHIPQDHILRAKVKARPSVTIPDLGIQLRDTTGQRYTVNGRPWSAHGGNADQAINHGHDPAEINQYLYELIELWRVTDYDEREEMIEWSSDEIIDYWHDEFGHDEPDEDF